MNAILVIHQGASCRAPFAIAQSGDPVDLTGCTVAAHLRLTPSSPLAASFAVTITDAPGGAGELVLTPTETAALAPGEYVTDLRLAFVGGEVLVSRATPVRVMPAVTHD